MYNKHNIKYIKFKFKFNLLKKKDDIYKYIAK
jgi:hypothetical protein